MTAFLGADTDQLYSAATLLRGRAHMLDELRKRLDPVIMDKDAWLGTDGDAFRAQWSSRASGLMSTLHESLVDGGEHLHEQAVDQDATSTGESGGVAAGVHGIAGASGAAAGARQIDTTAALAQSIMEKWFGDSSRTAVDTVRDGIDVFKEFRGLYEEGKKVWKALGESSAVRAAEELIYRVPDKTSDALYDAAKMIADKLDVPIEIGPWKPLKEKFTSVVDSVRRVMPWIDDLGRIAGKALPFVGPLLDVDQIAEGMRNKDWLAVTTASASLGGDIFMATGGLMMTTGILAPAGAPLVLIGLGMNLAGAAVDFGRYIVENWSTVSRVAGEVWNAGVNTVEWAADLGVSILTGDWDGVSHAAGQAWDVATDAAGDAWDWATDAAGDAWDWATEGVGEAWDEATGFVSEAWDVTTDIAGAAWDGLTDTWNDFTGIL